MKAQRHPYWLGFAVLLAGCGGSGSSSDPVATMITTTGTPTELSVEAGYGRVATIGTTVQLDATLADPSGDATLQWEQLSGATVALSDATIADPSFELPAVSASERLVFQLTADDGTNAAVTDTMVVEIVVPVASSSLADVGDFSDNADWGCVVDPIATPEVTVTDSGDQIDYVSNGIPAHATGTFPNSGNPNTITEQSVVYNVPANPEQTTAATDMQEFGVTIDGVKLERDTAESYQNARQWSYEAVTAGLAQTLTAGAEISWLGTDCNNAHVQPTGTYHYHGLPEALINELGEGDVQSSGMILGGYAADGFPFYLRYGYTDPDDASSGLVAMQGSWEVLSGTRSSGPGGSYDGTFREDWEYISATGDLDECNGRFGVTPEHPQGIYHYYLTDDYPFIPRCVFGTPDASFRARG